MTLRRCISSYYSILILDQTILIRYEDLCKKPEQIAKKLMMFLNLKEHEAIKRFIYKNAYNDVKPSISNAYKTKRNSSYMAFEWRKHLGNNDIASIQQHCENSMSLLGYNKMLNIKGDKLNENYPIMANNPFIM